MHLRFLPNFGDALDGKVEDAMTEVLGMLVIPHPRARTGRSTSFRIWSTTRSRPRPALIYVDHEGPNARKIDLSALMDAPRRVTGPLPNGLEVRREIEERLKPAASLYRVSFRVDPKADDEFSRGPLVRLLG